MTVFLLDAEVKHFQEAIFFTATRFEEIADRWFNGQPVGHRWKPFELVTVEDRRSRRKLPPGDFISIGAMIPIFSQRAVDCLGFLPRYGELLPLECQFGDYYAYNVTVLSDCLDLNSSVVNRLKDGRIYRVRKHVFRVEIVKDLVIFKLKQFPMSCQYVTETFVDRVNQHRLTGFKFTRRWSDTTG